MKNLLHVLILTLISGMAFGQTVTRTYVAPSSVSIDGVGNYGTTLPSVSFTTADFTAGCAVTDVDVTINWAKTDGTCTAPGSGCSFHDETSFRIDHPTALSRILALPGTWSGCATTTSVTTTFSDGNPIPTGTPVTGTFSPNNQLLSLYNGVSPAGNWSLSAGDNGSGEPLCVNWYSVTVTTDADIIAPILTVPGDITVNVDAGTCTAVVNYAAPTATDNCGATIVQTAGLPSGSVFPAVPTVVTYQATDPYGNVTTESFTVTVVAIDSQPATSITASATNVCAGQPVTLSVSGGVLGSGAQWLWYIGSCGGQLVGAGPTIVVNPLSTANYFVRPFGPCGTTVCVDVVIGVTVSPNASFGNIAGPSACGASDGSIMAIANGGTPPYSFAWVGGQTTQDIFGLAAGPYLVTVTDANGCTDFTSLSLNDPGASLVTMTSSDPDETICAGESVTFTATGAFQYQYYIDGLPVSTQNPFTTNTLTNGQVVHVTGIDFNFCSYTTTGIVFTVYDNPALTETIVDPSACATADGTIGISVSGGLPLYDFDWVTGQSSNFISGLLAGPYFVTVSDQNGCSTNGTYALNDPGAAPVTMTSSEDPNNEICDGESITFIAFGSVVYEFFVDGISESNTNPFTTSTLTDGQSVVATGTDGNNCTATSNIIYPIVNPGPTITLISDVPGDTICVGESISFFASGGIIYEFFVNGISQAPAGPTSVFVSSTLNSGDEVTVIGTDANQCDIESAVIAVTVNPSPTVSITNIIDPSSCGAMDGATSAQGFGGTPNYSYAWSTSAVGPTIAFLNAGSYFVTVTDAAGCTASTSASLSDVGSTPVAMTTDVSTDTICGGTSVTFTATGSVTYVYYVNGIQESTQNPYITNSLEQGDIVAVTGLDTMQCSATSDPITFTVHPEIQIGIISFTNPTACGASDGVANTAVIGGVPTYDYLWTDQLGQITPTATGLSAGPYAVTVTDANGCQSTDAVSLSDPGGFTVSLAADPTDLVICDGTEIEFTGSGANSYEFYIDGSLVNNTNPYTTSVLVDGETVTVLGTDLNNCTATSPGLTYQVDAVIPATLMLPPSVCANEDTVTFTGGSPLGGEYTVLYNNVPITGDLFFPNLAGPGPIDVTYTYTAINGCPASATAQYLVLPSPEVELGSDTTVCGITLDAGAGFTDYEWSPNGEETPTIDVDETNVYGVIVTDVNGCIGTDEIAVTINPIPDPIITPGGTVEFCVGDSVTLTAQTGFQNYNWSTSSTDEFTTVGAPGTVTLTVTNGFQCMATAEVELIMNEPMPGAQITPPGPHFFCKGQSILLDAGPGYASYLWNSGSTTQAVTVFESGAYTVVVLDGNGCIDSSMTADPVLVTVWDPEPLVSQAGDSLVVDNTSEFVAYQWYLDGDPIVGATGNVHVTTENGNYQVCGFDLNGCEGCSMVIQITGCCVGIEEAFFDGKVSVYPNPNNGRFTVEIEMERPMDMTVALYNVIGKQVWLDQELGNTSSLRKQYDINQIPDGVYFLRIFADDQMTVQKLIKQ